MSLCFNFNDRSVKWSQPDLSIAKIHFPHCNYSAISGVVCCQHENIPLPNLSFLFFFFPLCMAAPAAYGSSLARGPFGAAAGTYTTATATPDLSHIFDLRCSLGQHRILNARIEPASSWRRHQVFKPLSHSGNSYFFL